MSKVMVFIDGTWLYCNAPRLSDVKGSPEYRVNFGKLPRILCDELSKRLGVGLDLVRTNVFGSYAVNYDSRDDEAVQRRRDFFDLLREEFRFDVETYPINFMGRPLRRADRDPDDGFEPRETTVGIALASTLLYNAALSDAFDIAILVMGDASFRPALRQVRRMGKRVALASIRDACSAALSDPRSEAGVVDTDPIWLDELLTELELIYERHLLRCESPNCQGPREVWTTFHPRRGQKFYCEQCRAEFSRDRHEATGTGPGAGPNMVAAQPGEVHTGQIRRKINDRGYGFIAVADGREYFFHLTDLDEGSFDELREGEEGEFEVKREPANGQAGAAQYVRSLEPR